MTSSLPNDSVLAFEEVHFAYRHTPVLEGVSFSVKEGEFLGLIGPNGGGKTTLLKLLMGFVHPSSGTVTLSPKWKGSISYVPQAIQLDRQFPLSLMELVLMGRLSRLTWYGSYQSEDVHATEKALDQVGLLSRKNEAFSSLSLGQLQRAIIARALVSEPKLLLLDEPTASADPDAEKAIYELLQNLRGKITILMVTHDLEMTLNIFDRVLCIQKSVTCLEPNEVCQHFTVGLYHKPL